MINRERARVYICIYEHRFFSSLHRHAELRIASPWHAIEGDVSRHESFEPLNAFLNMTSCSDSCAGLIVNYIFLHSIAVLRAALRSAVISVFTALFMTRLLGGRAEKEKEIKNRPYSTAIKMLLFLRLINTYLYPATFFILFRLLDQHAAFYT